ncbi:MAG: glycosyltransferase [Planctomycetaceae bacterium]|nr:MAG: glycosyltransferase [Planctomycetaceae bacterium]
MDVVPVVAGRPPINRAVARLAAAGMIRLIESPSSCRDILATAGYTLLPIRHGSGTRLKVLEALAAGVVVIATGRAVEGLGLVDGTHYVRAETPGEMAKRLTELLRNSDAAKRIARNGRRFVIDNYTREVIGQAISQALVEARRSPASAAAA